MEMEVNVLNFDWELLQTKQEYILKNVLDNNDHQYEFLQRLFLLFTNSKIENIGLIIKILKNYMFEGKFNNDIPESICKESENLLPLLNSLSRIKHLKNYFICKNFSIKKEDIFIDNVITNSLIMENNNYIFDILKIEENFSFNTDRIEHFVKQKEQFLYYYILKKIFNSVVLKNQQDEQISELINQIKCPILYTNLLDDIFKLLFIRSSHMEHSSKQKNIIDSTSIFKLEIEHNKSNLKDKFICTEYELETILKSLKESIDKTKNSAKYSRHINEVLYKLHILTTLKTYSRSSISFEDLNSMVQCHNNIIEKTSSDDNCSNLKEQLSGRRKSKFKKRYNLGDSQKHSNETIINELTEKHNLICMLFSDFRTIATYALAFGNIDYAKNIMDTYKIDDSDLRNELNILSQMKIYKKKIKSISKTFEFGKSKNLYSNSIVERIRNVAAIGFEVSSIINIFEQFINSFQQFHQLKGNINRISKLAKSDNFLYLEQYETSNLKFVFGLDFVSNLDVGNEIYKNILNIIDRIGSLSDTALLSGIGYFKFLNVMSELIDVFKSTFQNSNANKMHNFLPMLTNSFTYDVIQIQKEFRNVITFDEINQKNINLIMEKEDMKYLVTYFKKSNSKNNYFFRINNFLKHFDDFLTHTNKTHNISQLFEVSPYVVVSDILLNNEELFLEIEKNIFLLNLNFIHVLIELIFPDFIKNETKYKQIKQISLNNKKRKAILRYISRSNNFLGQLLHRIDVENSSDSLESFLDRITKLDIISDLSVIQNKNLLVTSLLLDYVSNQDLFLCNDTFLIYSVYNGLKRTNSKKLIPLQSNYAKKLIYDDINHISLLESVDNILDRSSILIERFETIKDFTLLERLSNGILYDKDAKNLDIMVLEKIKLIKCETEIYFEIYKILNFKNWKEAYDLRIVGPKIIFKSLLLRNQFDLLKKWAKLIGIYKSYINKQFTNVKLKYLLDTKDELFNNLLDIFENFPMDYVNLLITDSSQKFHNLTSVFRIIIENYDEDNDNYEISLVIFKIMKNNNLHIDWDMLSKPLLLIEQLIMNSKFQLLSKVLNEIDNMLSKKNCKYCVIDSTDKYKQCLEFDTDSKFILLNFNLHKKDHILTSSCIDLLLRIYATKALDFQISNKSQIFYHSLYMSNDGISIDSSIINFKMPKIPPSKNEWMKDEETNNCQSCHYTIFTMLIRRHHCRRCGRVVCYACSKHRMKIPELYQDIKVRVCNDCVKEINDFKTRQYGIENIEKYDYHKNLLKWKLNGNLTHDKVVREQFCYEHACDVPLCLSILSHHQNKEKCITLLLRHCKKLESLLALKNPEVNFDSIANILSCLSLAAKIRGGPSECDSIREHADIIKAFAKSGSENLMILDHFDINNIKKLIYSLVDVEKWPLALDISFKRGISKTDVLSAYGLSFLRSGCFELAREKFMYCMTPVCSFADGTLIIEAITTMTDVNKKTLNDIRRPKQSPPLLSEIIRVIETTSNYLLLSDKVNENLLHNSDISISLDQFATTKENNNTSESAFIVLNTLSSLKLLSNFSNFNSYNKEVSNTKSKIFKECFYYLITYGSHTDIISFLIRYDEIKTALRYFVLQNFKYEYFISSIFLQFLKAGEVAALVQHMLDLEQYLIIWKNIFNCICRYLESKSLYNCLYQLQVLLKDPIRASMTCVRFYLKNCTSFKQLNDNLFHLDNAQKHLEAELELCENWENINFDKNTNKIVENTFPMQLDYKMLNMHLNSVLLQKEVTKFLFKCENENMCALDQLLPKDENSSRKTLPSLFGSVDEKIDIIVLISSSGRNLEEGFGLSFRIIQTFKLVPIIVYKKVSRFFSENNRIEEICKLCNCIKENNGIEEYNKEIDEIIMESVKFSTKTPGVIAEFKRLIKLVKNVETQITCYLHLDQFETAYILAEQHNQFDQLKNILNMAEEKKQFDIQILCENKIKNKLI